MSWRILLPENPSTGYRWEPDVAPMATDFLPTAPGRIGGGGLREFIWDDTVESVALTHRRSWEPAELTLERLFLCRKTGPTPEEKP